jgi:hypothetical protein
VQKIHSLNVLGITDTALREYVMGVVRATRLPSKMTPVSDCSIVGGRHRLSDPMYTGVILLQTQDYICTIVPIYHVHPTDFVQVNRIFKDGEVFYGASYKRMKEKKCNVVVLHQ